MLRLAPEDAERYVRLRRRMLVDTPAAFAASPEDDVVLDAGFVARALGPENAIFAVEGDGELVAAAGVKRQTKAKFRHRGDVWGVYVEPAHRGKGYARAILVAAIDLARSWPGVEWLDIGVSAATPGAQALYESLGFVAWGRSPEATLVGDQRHDEIFLSLRL
ncbi:MAG TPA: GNAT family N-acetyltransferase [Kofleriaceae bacterium]|nr:GNAT family N-acetyltransferase [Kofleriaceae bacterium]